MKYGADKLEDLNAVVEAAEVLISKWKDKYARKMARDILKAKLWRLNASETNKKFNDILRMYAGTPRLSSVDPETLNKGMRELQFRAEGTDETSD